MTYVSGFFIILGITIVFLTIIGLSFLAIDYLADKVEERFGGLAGIVTVAIGVAFLIAAVFTGSAILNEVVPMEGLFK